MKYSKFDATQQIFFLRRFAERCLVFDSHDQLKGRIHHYAQLHIDCNESEFVLVH